MMRLRLCVLLAISLAAVGCGDSDSSEQPQTQSAGESPPKTGDESRAKQSGDSISALPDVALPEDLPDDIPIYPGSTPKIAGTVQGSFGASPSTSIVLVTTDSAEKVQTFYKTEIEKHGWTWTEGVTGPRLFNAKQGKRNINVTVVELPDQPGTVQIRVNYNEPDKSSNAEQP